MRYAKIIEVDGEKHVEKLTTQKHLDFKYKDETPTLKELKNNNWLPIKWEKPKRKSWEKVENVSQIINEDEVVFKENIKEVGIENYRKEKKKRIQKKLTNEIENRGHDIYAQLNASLGTYTKTKSNKIKKEVKKLYSEYKDKIKILESASSYQEIEDVYEPFISYIPKDKLDENNKIIVEDII